MCVCVGGSNRDKCPRPPTEVKGQHKPGSFSGETRINNKNKLRNKQQAASLHEETGLAGARESDSQPGEIYCPPADSQVVVSVAN